LIPLFGKSGMVFTQQQTNMDSSLLTPAHFMSDERLDRVIKYVPPEIWEIIYTYKEQAETRDRLDRYKVQLVRINGTLDQQAGWRARSVVRRHRDGRYLHEWEYSVLTAAQEEEAKTDDMVRCLKNDTVAELKDECRKNGMQVSGGKFLLMIRIIAFRMYGKKLKGDSYALWSSLQHAPQKMWDAGVKCNWATEREKSFWTRDVGYGTALEHAHALANPLRHASGRYYCGHQLPGLIPH